MFQTRALLISSLAVLFLGTASANADPIALTGGGVSIGFQGRPNIWTNLVVGDTVYSVTRDVRAGEVINPQCPCPVGSTIDPSNILTGPFFGTVSYFDGRPPLFSVTYDGVIRLIASSTLVETPIGPGFLTSGPFQMIAALSAFQGTRTLFLNRTFTGTGTFGLMLESDASFLHIGYDLPEVPEPSTMVLLGSGIAALFARRRRAGRAPRA